MLGGHRQIAEVSVEFFILLVKRKRVLGVDVRLQAAWERWIACTGADWISG